MNQPSSPAPTVAIVGLGLIGGSMAIDLRHNRFARQLIGVDSNPTHAETALRIGLVDQIMPLADAVDAADLVIVATPVDTTLRLLPTILDLTTTSQVVVDVASTKGSIMHAVASHPRRRRFVGSHPMAGTENSGPWAAHAGLFESKAAIICDAEASDTDAVALVERLYDALYMRVLRMEAGEHDVHVAYVSHISHVSSFALALTVLAKEKDEKNIFNLASGGFSSTVRLAKSDADMWVPIFLNNRDNVLTVLDTYGKFLDEFRARLLAGEREPLEQLIREANTIRRVLK
jgi:prephenate dehydrogenase